MSGEKRKGDNTKPTMFCVSNNSEGKKMKMDNEKIRNKINVEKK